MKMKNAVRLLINAIVAISLCGFVLSCGGGGGDDSGGSSSGQSGSITLAVNLTSIPADGSSSAVISAQIKDSAGNAVRHYTDVTFTTTLGHFRNGGKTYTMQTQPPLGDDGFPDIDKAPTGIAEVQFIAGSTPGSAKITANSNGVTNSIYVTLTGGVGAIALTATPETIPADGGSAVKVTATVTDPLGGPVNPGTEVSFKTGLGFFENGAKTFSLKTTDATGIVDVSVIAGVVPGTTYVEASSGNVAQALSLVLTKTDPLYCDISVEADPSMIQANGEAQSVITATVTRRRNTSDAEVNATGVPIADIPITFYKITSNAVPQPLPEANTYIGTGTSIAGPFYSYGGLVTFYMTAVPGGSTTDEYLTVWLFNPLSGKRELLISRANWGWDDTLLEDMGLSLLPGNYQLEIQTNCYYEIKVVGDIGPAQTGKTVLGFTKTDTNGNAFQTYTSDWLPGTFNIKAETGDLSNSENALSEEVALIQTPGTPEAIVVKTASDSIYANGKNDTTVTVQVWVNGNQAPDGTAVSFSATSGTIDANAFTVDGIASTKLVSIASATSVDATVTATVGAKTGTKTVKFVGVSLSNMQATPAAIFANGTDTSQITLRLHNDSGIAVSGEALKFTTTKGTLNPENAVTTSEGVATVTLTAPTTTGTATITATYGTITTTTTVSFEAMGDGSITLTANPTSIPADGTSSSAITATVTYSSGAAVPKGTSVTFTTNLGTFSNGAQTYTVITPTETGVVSVSLISTTTPGSAKVTATAINASQTVYVGMGGAPISITLEANPTTIPADGASSSTITATLTDAAGKPVTPGTSVTFSTTLGTFSNTTATITVTTLDDTGKVSVALIAGTIPGSATVTATSSGVSHVVEVTFSGSPAVGSIQVSADPTAISADGKSTSTITATVKTADNQVVPDAQVTFTTSRGAITSPHTTDAAGKAVATLTSAQNNDPSVLVTATSQGVSGTVLVSFTGLSLTVVANPTSVLTGESSTITATFKDASGNPINGATLTFSTDKGTLNPDTSQQTDASGQAIVTLTSTTSGTATVTVTGGGATATTTVNFTRYLFTLEANPTTIRVTETSVITATLLDSGVAKAGETVFFSSTLGVLSPFQAVTGADGKAASTLTAGTQSGIAVIDGTVTIATNTPPTDLAANTQVVITGGAAKKVILATDPSVIATNSGVATLTATVYDATDQPVPDQNVYFRINKSPGGGEYLSASVKITNSFGVATVQLYAGSLPSTYEGVKIEANTQADFGGSLGLTTLTIAGPVANIGIGMDLHTLTPEGGDLTVDITAIATDVNGNPVSDGTLVSFSVQAVEFDEDRANDQTIDCWNGDGTACDCPLSGAVVIACTGGFGTAVTGWFSDDVNQDNEMYGCDNITCDFGPMSTTEDVNHNGILDPGEDKNENGVIDPIQGTVIDGSVATTGGLARAKLVYPQPQAKNIRVRITAEAGGISNFYETILLCTQDMVDNGTCGIGY